MFYLLCALFSFVFFMPASLTAENFADFNIIKDILNSKVNPQIVTKKIEFANFPNAFNPSICKTDQGIILSFRYFPDKERIWISQCVMVLLDEFFKPISEPQIISFRNTDLYPPYFEDCRVFSFDGKIYALYSDFSDSDFPASIDYNPFLWEYPCKEYMHLAEIGLTNNQFAVGPSLKLIYPEKINNQKREKNWVPFEWNGKLYFSYYLFPHEVLEPNLITGECQKVYLTTSQYAWNLGEIRGTTPAILVDGEYLAFFHSSQKYEKKNKMYVQRSHYYFMGAYTFSPEPPFAITKASADPIIAKGFYTHSENNFLHAIFPCSYFVDGDDIYFSYGKDDCEIWIAKISKREVFDSLVPVQTMSK